MDTLLFRYAESTSYNYLASGKLQNIGEETLLLRVKVTFLAADWSMRARGEYVDREDILKGKMPFNPFRDSVEIELQRRFENLCSGCL